MEPAAHPSDWWTVSADRERESALIPARICLDPPSSFPPAENDNTTPKADSADGLSTAHSPSQQQEAHIGRDLEADEEEATLADSSKVKQEPFADEEEHQQQQLDEQQAHSELELLARDECQQPLAKRPKMELVDAEANTVHTGEQASQSIPLSPPPFPCSLWYLIVA